MNGSGDALSIWRLCVLVSGFIGQQASDGALFRRPEQCYPQTILHDGCDVCSYALLTFNCFHYLQHFPPCVAVLLHAMATSTQE